MSYGNYTSQYSGGERGGGGYQRRDRDRINEEDVPESKHTIFVRGLPGNMSTDEIKFENREDAKTAYEKYSDRDLMGHRCDLSWFRDIRRYAQYQASQGRPIGGGFRGRGNFRGRGHYTRGSYRGGGDHRHSDRDRDRSRSRSRTRSRSRSRGRSGTRSLSRSPRRRSYSSRSRSPVESDRERDRRRSSSRESDVKRDRTPDRESAGEPDRQKKDKRKKEKKAKKRKQRSRSHSRDHSEGEVRSDDEMKKLRNGVHREPTASPVSMRDVSQSPQRVPLIQPASGSTSQLKFNIKLKDDSPAVVLQNTSFAIGLDKDDDNPRVIRKLSPDSRTSTRSDLYEATEKKAPSSHIPFAGGLPPPPPPPSFKKDNSPPVTTAPSARGVFRPINENRQPSPQPEPPAKKERFDAPPPQEHNYQQQLPVYQQTYHQHPYYQPPQHHQQYPGILEQAPPPVTPQQAPPVVYQQAPPVVHHQDPSTVVPAFSFVPLPPPITTAAHQPATTAAPPPPAHPKPASGLSAPSQVPRQIQIQQGLTAPSVHVPPPALQETPPPLVQKLQTTPARPSFVSTFAPADESPKPLPLPTTPQAASSSTKTLPSTPLGMKSSAALAAKYPTTTKFFADLRAFQSKLVLSVKAEPKEEDNFGGLRLSLLSVPEEEVDESATLMAREQKLASLDEMQVERFMVQKKKLEAAFRNDCETFGIVTKKLLSKDENLEQALRSALIENMEDLEKQMMLKVDKYLDEI